MRLAAAWLRGTCLPQETDMERMGFLIPLWLLGAPLVLAILERMRTPAGGRAAYREAPAHRPGPQG